MVTRRITPSVVGVIKLIVLSITFFVKCSNEYKFISLHQNAILMTGSCCSIGAITPQGMLEKHICMTNKPDSKGLPPGRR